MAKRVVTLLLALGLIFLSQSEVLGESNALRKSSELLSRASALLWPSTQPPSLTAAESSLASDGGQSNYPQNPRSALQALAFKWPVLSSHAPPEASVVAKQTSSANTIYWPGMTVTVPTRLQGQLLQALMIAQTSHDCTLCFLFAVSGAAPAATPSVMSWPDERGPDGDGSSGTPGASKDAAGIWLWPNPVLQLAPLKSRLQRQRGSGEAHQVLVTKRGGRGKLLIEAAVVMDNNKMQDEWNHVMHNIGHQGAAADGMFIPGVSVCDRDRVT